MTSQAFSGSGKEHDSLLSVIAHVDNFPYEENSFFWKFVTPCGQLLGYITPTIAARFKSGPHAVHFDVNEALQTVVLKESMGDFNARNAAFMEIAKEWRLMDEDLNHGWRDELYTVYFPRATPYLLLERAFACLLGVATYGVHINGYVLPQSSTDGKLKMWIPRRAATKQTYPGKLDNTIAGGLAHPYSVRENAIKECHEEGGLAADFVLRCLSSTGVVTYIHQPYGPQGHVQPEVEFIYDLEFPSESAHIPTPVDGEAENFTLMDIDEVMLRLFQGEFKPNCALVIADFLIRHGYVTWDNEANYMEIVSRLHRRLPMATMS